MVSYVDTLNLVRIAIKHRVKFINIPISKGSRRILVILLYLNIIDGIWFSKNKKNHLVYSISCNLASKKQVVTFIKPSKQLFVKYKDIIKLTHKYSSTTIYLSTSHGVISLKEAFIKKTGGILFFRII